MVKTKFYKIGALAITLSMVIGSAAFASSQSVNKTSNNKSYIGTHVKNNKEGFNFKIKLDALVKAGTITQVQEDSAIKLIKPTKEEGFRKGNKGIKVKLDSLVKVGTITQTQEDAIVKLFTPNKEEGFRKGNKGIKVKLDSLVKAGTMTQAQEDAMISALTPLKK